VDTRVFTDEWENANKKLAISAHTKFRDQIVTLPRCPSFKFILPRIGISIK